MEEEIVVRVADDLHGGARRARFTCGRRGSRRECQSGKKDDGGGDTRRPATPYQRKCPQRFLPPGAERAR